MPSRTSFCNFAIIRKNLTRGWPLWLAYTILWMIVLPLSLTSHHYDSVVALRLFGDVLEITSIGGVLINGFYGLFVAGVLFSYQFTSRSINTMAALPIRRETMFGSNLVVGLLVSVVPNLLISLAVVVAGATLEVNLLTVAFQSFCMNTLVYLFCFGMGTISAALVGSALGGLLMYILLNGAAVTLQAALIAILSGIVYGMPNAFRFGTADFGQFSPLYKLLESNSIDRTYEEVTQGGQIYNQLTAVTYTNWNYLYIIAGVGVLMLILAFFLMKYRHMEAAGDFMAVKPLRPVFKYIFAGGCSLVLGYLIAMCLNLDGNFWGVLGCMAFGGFIGYFLAEIMLKKSFAVWKREWIGFGCFTALLLVMMLGVKFDAYGYEKHIPELEDIASVQYSMDYYDMDMYAPITDDGLIYDVVALHQRFIDEKQDLDNEDWGNHYGWQSITIQYTLENGESLSRYYNLPHSFADYKDKTSLFYQAGVIYNDPIMVMNRVEPSFLNLSADDFVGGEIRYGMETYDEMTGEQLTDRETLDLSKEQAYALYQSCIIPDLEDGAIGYNTDFKPYYTDWSLGRTAIYFYYVDNNGRIPMTASHDLEVSTDSTSFVVYEDSTRTAPAVEDLGIPIYQTVRTN
ncbi:MAG: hypothetical protein R3Y62_05955 [Eubacteriales bacterium]